MRAVTKCRICGSTELRPVLDLGAQPAVNVLSPRIAAARYPLELVVCSNCWHGQLSVVVSQDILYDNYSYASSTVGGLQSYFTDFVELAARHAPGKSVLEIACNDGPQLEAFAKDGWTVQGVDPAANLVKRARAKGLAVANAYWNQETADLLHHRHGYHAIVAQNVLGHVDDPRAFLAACDSVLAPRGRLFLQTSHANWLINGEFDTIYHEHLSYFNCSSWAVLLGAAGWTVEKLYMPSTNGTSYLLVVARSDDVQQFDSSFWDRSDFEDDNGYFAPEVYLDFARRTGAVLTQLKEAVDAQSGYSVIFGYGAAAKGITALIAAQARLDFIVDDSPLKQGKEVPFLDTPIVGPERLDCVKHRPWFVVATAGLYKDRIKAKLLAAGGHGTLCTYLPKFQLETF